MSNASNLSNLANVLDDGTSGQVLTSQGSGVVAFADAASGTGVTVHNNQAAMLTDAASADEGSLHYENDNNKLYVKQSSGFFLLASITNTAPTVSDFTETTGGGSANTILDNGTFALTSGSNTVITLTATDPDLETLVYSATVTSGTASNVISSPSLPISNQSGNTFTLTPVTSGAGGTITIRFDVSDGNNVVNKTHSFSIAFQVVNSNHTTLLLTATGTSDNSTITDSSSANSGSGHNITVTGDAYAGTFSPYRSGGYSTFFDGSGDYIDTNSAINLSSGGCIEGWVYITSATNYAFFIASTQGNPGYPRWYVGHSNATDWRCSPGDSTDNNITSYDLITNQWNHFVLSNDGSRSRLFANGVLIFTKSVTPVNENLTFTLSKYGSSAQYLMTGNLFDVRVNTSIPTEYQTSSTTVGASIFTPPYEPLSSSGSSLHICHLPYLADGSSNTYTLTPNGEVSTKPFTPYDYDEYDAADHGGSLYFNGTNSAVEIADNDDFDFGTGDLTIECWVYPEVTSNSYPGFLGTSAGWGSVAASGFRFDNLGDSKFQMSWYGPGDPFLETQSTYKHNQWYHFVVTRTGGSTWRMFVNGILEDTGTNSTAYDISIGGNNLQVGGKTWDGGNGWFKGNIADLRLTKGSVVSEYQTTSTTVGTKIFTPRTSPISSSGSELHLKGTDASIIDKSQTSNIKLEGGVNGSTDEVRTGNWANTKTMYFDAEGDYIDVSNGFIPLRTSDFAIETWFYPTASPPNHEGIFTNGTHNVGNWLALLYQTNRKIRYDIGGGSSSNISTTTLSLNNWHHIMLCRFDGNIRLYINGVHEHSESNSSDLDYETALIGNRIGLTGYVLSSAYLQDFRITRGLVRHVDTQNPTTSFTPPSAPLEG